MSAEEEITQAIIEAQRQAYLDCVRICKDLKFTEQGPTTEAKHQRMLCANAILTRMKELGYET